MAHAIMKSAINKFRISCAGCVAASLAGASARSALVGWYRYDEGAGNVAIVSAGGDGAVHDGEENRLFRDPTPFPGTSHGRRPGVLARSSPTSSKRVTPTPFKVFLLPSRPGRRFRYKRWLAFIPKNSRQKGIIRLMRFIANHPS